MADLTCDVLVVGAGPTGLMLANWLVRLGVDVIVADGKDGPTRESRALGLQARSLEIYDQLGIGELVLAAAHRADAVAPGFLDRSFGRLALGALGQGLTPYPYLEILEQSRNEEILYENLQKLGGEVRWRNTVTGLTRTAYGVEAAVGYDTVRARFCVGCDGAGSMVRKARRIDFAGITNPNRFYVLDAVAAGGLVENAINVRPGTDDFLIAFPMKGAGNWRFIGLVDDEDGDGELTEKDVRPRIHRFGITYREARWFATYKVHHRIAAVFRDGPFFLAGDAAHVHSPIGGQGMNTGLQDAHNLAFKLADVLHQGSRKDDWLDRYEAERRPVAEHLVATTDRLFGRITSQTKMARVLRRTVFPLLAPAVIRALPGSACGSRLFQYVSQIRIRYPMTPGAEPAGGYRDPLVGRRLPWTGDNFGVLRCLRWQIHVYGGVTAAEIPDVGVAVHVFPAAPQTPLRPGRLYLVRPDGFVAAESTPTDAVRAFPPLMA